MSMSSPARGGLRRVLPVLVAAVVCACDGSAGTIPSLHTLEISPETTLLAAGEVVRVDVILRDGQGRVVPGATARLATADAGVALVDASGRLRAVQPGRTVLRGTAGEAADSVEIHVGEDPARMTLARYEGQRLPILVDADSVDWDEGREYHEVYVVGGELGLTRAPVLRYQLQVFYEQYVVHGEGAERTLTLRASWSEFDRGVVAYDDAGDVLMTSEYVAPLHHRAVPSEGGLTVDYRIPGSDLRLDLEYRR